MDTSSNKSSIDAEIIENEIIQSRNIPSTPQVFGGLKYFILGDNVAILSFHIVTILLMLRVIYCYYFNKQKLKTSNLAASMLIFLWTHVICALLDVPYHLYLLVKWNPTTQDNYDPYVLYWTGISVALFNNITSLSVLFLSLDRLLALKLPYYYNARIARFMPSVTVIVLIGSTIPAIILNLMALPLEMDKGKLKEK